ncbi:MAG: carboxypeptidase-like regulatory domain-containing protein [Bacteroidota bacterium]
MNNKYALCFLLLMAPFVLFSQGTLNGKVSEQSTKNPIPCCEVKLFNNNHEFMTFSNQNGEYSFQGVPVGTYKLRCFRNDYFSYQETFTLCDDSMVINITLDSIIYLDGSNDSVEVNDWFDYTFGIDLYYYTPGNKLFKNNLSMQPFNVEFRRLLTDQMQWGLLVIPLELGFHNFKNPEVNPIIKPAVLDEFHNKKNYRNVSAGITFYIRRILAENNFGTALYYIDLGLGYKIPYTYKLNYLNDANSKVTINGIHKFNQFDFMMRLGFDIFAIKANIRITDHLSYKQIPRYSLGLEMSVPRY